MKRLSFLLLMLIAIINARGQTTSWNSNVTWTPQFRQVSGAYEVRFALGGTKPYYNLSDSLNMIRNAFANYYTKTQADALLAAKQATLISGTNIKTINGNSLLGSGNIVISGGGSSYTFNNGLTESSGIVGLGGDGIWNYTSQARIGGLGKATLNLTTNSANLSSPITSGSGSYQVQSTGIFTNIQFNSKISSIEILNNRFTVRDSVNSEGMKYAQKYRLNLTNRSIMDKEYIDSVAAASGGTSGVTSFNSRTGAVTPQSSDYSSFYYPLTGNPSGFITSSDLTPYALDANVVHKTGSETIAGLKTFSNSPVIGNASGNTTINSNSIYFNQSGNFLSLQPPTLTGIRLQNFQDDDGQIALTKNITSAISAYTPPSQVQNSLSPGSTTLAPSVTATNDALALKANLAGTNIYTSGNADYKGGGVRIFDFAGTNVLANLNKISGSGYEAGGLMLYNRGSLNGNVTIQSNETNNGSFTQKLQAQNGTIALLGDLDSKQATLVSGTNIKTINGNSVLGSGDLVISGGTPLNLTTTGTSGAATLNTGVTPNVLNIPNYVATDFYPEPTEFEGQGTSADKFRLKAAGVSVAKGGTGVGTLTGIVKGNGTSPFTAAIASDFPTLNQSTTGSAASLTTTRTIWGQNFNGTGNVTGALSGATTIGASGIITGSSFTGAGTGLTGTAASLTVGNATKLATARTIGTTGITSTAASFDGSANVNIAVTAVPGSLVTGTVPNATNAVNANTATKWGGGDANFSVLGTNLTNIVAFDNLGVAKPYSVTQVKTALNTTLQDATTAGNIISRIGSGSNATPLIEDMFRYGIDGTAVSKIRGVNTFGNNLAVGFSFSVNGTSTANTDLEILRMMPNKFLVNNPTDNGNVFQVNGSSTISGSLGITSDLAVGGNVAANNLGSGTYNPTITITDGSGTVSSATPTLAHYTRLGSQVTVYGAISLSTTASTSNVTLEMNLPITSNLGTVNDLYGHGSVRVSATNYSANIGINANATTDKANFFLNTASGSSVIYYSFMYTVL